MIAHKFLELPGISAAARTCRYFQATVHGGKCLEAVTTWHGRVKKGMRSEVVSRDPVFLANESGGLLGEVQANLSDDRLRKVERPLRYLSQVRLLALRCSFR
ncbi:hypothetical protein TNIN_266591 [Trichonephila inaurata madagascariensis]|uniref:Uncharacterized protein n=1 Tax=Trichonephila inaurata madagascariensis TaxID=2747483 RepID=A0A8X6WTF5_9ARAC|nr:hypothetical protein TNIN_266591 [Trichonephila inaurata madagascariensis]